jgi:hypothetical protein
MYNSNLSSNNQQGIRPVPVLANIPAKPGMSVNEAYEAGYNARNLALQAPYDAYNPRGQVVKVEPEERDPYAGADNTLGGRGGRGYAFGSATIQPRPTTERFSSFGSAPETTTERFSFGSAPVQRQTMERSTLPVPTKFDWPGEQQVRPSALSVDTKKEAWGTDEAPTAGKAWDHPRKYEAPAAGKPEQAMVPFTKQSVVAVEDMEENPFMVEFMDKRIKAGLAAYTKKIVPMVTAMVTSQVECASEDIYARLDAIDGKGGPPRITQPTIEDAPAPGLGGPAAAGPVAGTPYKRPVGRPSHATLAAEAAAKAAAEAAPSVTTAEDIAAARAAMSTEDRAADKAARLAKAIARYEEVKTKSAAEEQAAAEVCNSIEEEEP